MALLMIRTFVVREVNSLASLIEALDLHILISNILAEYLWRLRKLAYFLLSPPLASTRCSQVSWHTASVIHPQI